MAFPGTPAGEGHPKPLPRTPTFGRALDGPRIAQVASYASQSITYGQAFLNTIVAAWKTTASAALIATAKVRLIHEASFTISPQTTIAQLAAQECDYSGYTAGGVALVVGAPVNLSLNAQGAVTGIQFLATAATPFVADTAYGYWVDDGTNMIAGEMFAGGVGITFASAGAFLELILELPLQVNQATS